MTQAAPVSGSSRFSPFRISLFSVQDHYPSRQRKLHELYQEAGDQCVLAEQLGYDSFFVAEHHFHEYGVVPDPAVYLAALAQRTSTIRLGSAIAPLTFHNPLTLAESYAMVDVLSNGRLTLGVGSGYLKHEFAGHAIDPAEKRDRFDENLAILNKAMTGERLSFAGRFSRIEDVAINVASVQRPTPPMYTAVISKMAAYFVGKQGNNIMCVPYASVDSLDEVAGMIADYKRGCSESGVQGDTMFAFHAHAAATDEEARRRAAEHFDLYVATRLYAKRHVYDDIMQSGLSLMGSVETVANTMVRMYEMGITHVLLLQNFGAMPPEVVKDSMRLFAQEVMPRVSQLIAQRKAA
jgi:alkanesulfonate monooxygenase SsuD/methylene tetrahydromethanopterin reductase-like flavin-dependent oxidoreductase (luciferase family)